MKHLKITGHNESYCGSTNKNFLASGSKNRTNPDLATFSEFGLLIYHGERVCKKCQKRYEYLKLKKEANKKGDK